MTALWIILGIVLFFALLLFVPVHVAAKYDDSLALRIRYLFISLKFPKPPLSPEQEAKKAEKKRKKQTSNDAAEYSAGTPDSESPESMGLSVRF